jgi:hypothetical protein
VDDPRVLRLAHFHYRKLWSALEPEQREGLDDPASLVLP